MSELYPCLSGEELLRSEKIKHYPFLIKNFISCSETIYNDLYKKTLHHVAEYCQAMIFSTVMFNHPYGFLERQLELTTKMLQLRRGRLFPKNAGAEQISSEESAWTYALYSAGLLDNLFHLRINREVKMMNSEKQDIGIWNPMASSLYKQAKFYEVRITNHPIEHQDVLMAALAEHIIPISAINWLRKYPHLFKQWWDVILQNDSVDNEMNDMIKKAKASHHPEKQPTHALLFLEWIEKHAADYPDDIFRVKDGLFIKQNAIQDFCGEHPPSSESSLLTELQSDDLLIVIDDEIYHRYAPINFSDRNIITGVILNMDLLPQFESMRLNRSYHKEICS